MATNIIKLESERKRLNLNRRAFSKLLGVRPEYYTRLMATGKSSLALTDRMAKALNCEMKDLLI